MAHNVHIAGSEYEDVPAIPSIFAEEYPVATTTGKIASGEGKVGELTVLGRVTATGEYKVCNLAASDGSEKAAAILVAGWAVDATSSAKDVKVYTSGAFNMEALTWHSSFDTDAKKLAALKLPPLYVKKPVFAA